MSLSDLDSAILRACVDDDHLIHKRLHARERLTEVFLLIPDDHTKTYPKRLVVPRNDRNIGHKE